MTHEIQKRHPGGEQPTANKCKHNAELPEDCEHSNIIPVSSNFNTSKLLREKQEEPLVADTRMDNHGLNQFQLNMPISTSNQEPFALFTSNECIHGSNKISSSNTSKTLDGDFTVFSSQIAEPGCSYLEGLATGKTCFNCMLKLLMRTKYLPFFYLAL